MDADEAGFVAAMARVSKVDRDAFRELRRRMWEMAAAAHAEQTPAQREQWLKKSS